MESGEFISETVMRLFADGRPRTRADVIAELGFARSTITPHLDVLLGMGLLQSKGVAQSTGGRPPAAYVLNPDTHRILAIDVGPRHLRLALSDLEPKILAEQAHDFELVDDPASVFDAIEAHTADLLRTCNPAGLPLAGIGIGLPMPVHYVSGRPMKPPLMPRWDGYDLCGRLAAIADVPSVVDRDNNLRALGEFEGGSPQDSLLYVHVSTYIGCGLVIDGRLARGAEGSAGYIGHVTGEWSRGQLCLCGKRGCLEAVASSRAIVQQVGRELGITTTSELVSLAGSGDLMAKRAVHVAGRTIGVAIANFVSVLNPTRVVIGGSLAVGNLDLISGIRETVYSKSFPLPVQLLQVGLTKNAHRSVILGANRLVRDRYFQNFELRR